MINKSTEQKHIHVYLILFVLILLACGMTFIIPSGSFDTFFDATSKSNIVVDGSYHLVENVHVYPWSIPMLFFKTLTNPSVSKMIFFILIIGGSFEPLMESQAFTFFIQKIVAKKNTTHRVVVISFLVAFSIIGFSTGLTTASIIFIPIALSISKSLGINDLVAISMVMLGTNIGFTAGVFNPFNVGIAQSIAEVPIFSGSWLRWLVLIAYLIATGLYLIYYSKKNLQISETCSADASIQITLTARQIVTLVSFTIFLIILMSGVNLLKWGIPEIASLFLVQGIIVGLIMGYSPNRICELYVLGFKKMVKGAFIIGLAATIKTILLEGFILDTVAYAMSQTVYNLPQWAQLTGIFYGNAALNLLITSGSGQAALIMPILVPMSDLLHLTRQSVVFAFQMGDGLTNLVSPISTTLSTILAISGIHYGKWFKFYMPLVAIYLLIGTVFMFLATAVGY
ncbi:MAG: YfcC family protein [Clostridia bacterium]|nr:YfcC family protein [Clostridia bacterium]